MLGATVSHYRILEKIGEGGMGVVYRAEDVRLGRHVAVKFVAPALCTDTAALDRFQRETRAASSLNHPNICAVYDIGEHAGQPFLVMELLEGRTLRQIIGGVPLPTDMVLDLSVQIVDALGSAHAQGIVHRDIKSANILVNDRGQVKVLDFGLAKLAAHAQLRALGVGSSALTAVTPDRATGTGLTVGTVSYMSPEQIRGEDLDTRSDLFSFGVLLYQMATGHEPFAGRSSALIFDAILHDTPVAPTTHNPRVPAELEHIIAKALEKDRDLRYQTAAELRADLKRLKRETDSARGVAPPAIRSVLRSKRGNRGVVWATALVVAIAAAAGVGIRLLRPTSQAIDSVTVLPFTSAGNVGDIEYLTDGITETLINSLSQLSGVRVSARSLAFKYKGRDVDPQKVGRDLNVKAVITGRAAVRGGRLVIQADLMDVANGTQLWGGQYNKPLTDILAVQDQIAADIFDNLRLRLTGEDKKRATKRDTESAEAYQLYLQGRFHWNKATIAGYKKAIEYFQQAIDKDPRYAVAYAGLADSNLLLGTYWVEAIPPAKSAAEKALDIDPNLAEAHVALGHIKLWLDWDWPAADREFTKGISLNPASALAHNEYAMYLALLDRPDEAVAEGRRALEIEPLSPIINSDLGWEFLYAGRHREAIDQFAKTLELDQNSVAAHRGLGIEYAEARRYDEAIAELKTALELSERSPIVLGHLGAVHALKGATKEVEQVLADLKKLAEREYVPSSAAALIDAARGQKARALDALERAFEEHDFSMVQLRVAPWFKTLRGDPRFERLLARIGAAPGSSRR